ncbi:hypothetical protein ACFMKP_21625 [Herpetosiphon sp. NSE202]
MQLAFIEVCDPWRTNELHTQINNLTMLSDKGELTVRAASYSPPDPTSPDYRYSTVKVSLNELEPGTYRFSQMRYRDENKQEHIITIGDWELIIIDSPPAPLKPDYLNVIGGEFRDHFSVTLANTSTQMIQLFDTPIKSSKYPISSTLHLAQQIYDGSGSPVPVPANKPSSSSVSSIDIQPQQNQAIALQLYGLEQLPSKFVAIQAAIEYKQGQAPSQMYILPLQVFLPPFENDQAIKQYLSTLPADAAQQ